MCRATLLVAALLSAVLLAVTSSAGLAGCGGSRESSPDAAVQDLIHLLNARNFGEAYEKLASDSVYAELSQGDFALEMEKIFGGTAANLRLSGFRALEVTIDGESASVEWTASWVTGIRGEDQGSIEATSTVVREDGEWKVLRMWE